MLKSPRFFSTGIALLLVLAVLSFWHIRPQDRVSNYIAKTHKPKQNPAIGFKANSASLKDVHNSTLGFQKVFTINLPSRPDKLDQFALISSLTGFKTAVIEGVNGHEVTNKSLPALEGLPKTENTRDNVVGCWRAHLNFARTIVNEGLTSALVMEDDADWDTGLKDQLELFAQGSQFVTAVEPGQEINSPYGDDWDLIWLGHCGSEIMPDDQRRFVIENDATVPTMERRTNFAAHSDMAQEGYDNHTRVVFRAKRALCLYAYALSYRGARKLLRDQATLKKFRPIDIGIGDWCENDPSVKCIGVNPQLIDSHKGAGRLSRDSDIGDFSPKEFRNKGYTFNVVHSTRLNVDHLLAGEREKIERQWPNDPEVSGPPRPKAMGRVLETG